MVVTPSVPVKANSGVRARVPAAARKVLEGDDQPTVLREDVHYLHYITIRLLFKLPALLLRPLLLYVYTLQYVPNALIFVICYNFKMLASFRNLQ